MSHIQPHFIAKAKSQIKKPVQRLPRKMLIEEARAVPALPRNRDTDYHGWMWWDSGSVDHRIFTLKK